MNLTHKVCECTKGDPTDGCKGADAPEDHTLACTQFQDILERKGLNSIFEAGGPCVVDGSSSINKSLLEKGTPRKLKIRTEPFKAWSSTPPPEVAVVMTQAVLQTQAASKRSRGPPKDKSDFICGPP